MKYNINYLKLLNHVIIIIRQKYSKPIANHVKIQTFRIIKTMIATYQSRDQA